MLNKVDNHIWSGRTDHLENRTSFRYHQVVEVIAMEDLSPSSRTCAIIGFESEEGVRRNKGQLGAAKAPNALRSELAKLPWKFSVNERLVDVGNIQCVGTGLETAQQQLGDTIANVLEKK